MTGRLMRMNTFLATAIATLVLGPVSLAQTTTVAVQDHSPQGCPLRLTGEAEFRETLKDGKANASVSSSVVGTNTSDKTVMAFTFQIEYASSYSPLVMTTNEYDGYFDHDLEIPPGQTYVHQHQNGIGRFSMPFSPSAVPSRPHADGTVLFVQFADGSTWGNVEEESVKDLIAKRVELLNILKKLDKAANESDSQFLAVLAQKASDESVDGVLAKIRSTQTSKGVGVAVQQVRNMLAIGATRTQGT